MPILVLVLAFLAGPALAAQDCASCSEPLQAVTAAGGDWHLMVRNYEHGPLGLWRGLTEHECEFMRARAMGEPATDAEKAAAALQAAKDKAEAERRHAERDTACFGKPLPGGGLSGVHCKGGTSAGDWVSVVTSYSSGGRSVTAECFR